MTEADAVDAVDEPVTVDRIASDLRDLGVSPGDTLLVHSALRAVGWVAGGAQAVVDALRESVTADGTVVMPTFTSQYTDPAGWVDPPVPDHWVETLPEAMPPYRPAVTPTRGMGAVPECFRTYPDVLRSDHPTVSFAAWGENAASIVDDHPLDEPLGEDSPLARLYERDADVLFLGTDHETTSLHLAEYRADLDAGRTMTRATVRRDGEPLVVEFEDQELSTEDFTAVGSAFEDAVGLARGPVGAADARLASQRAMVDFAVDWFEENR